MGDNSKWILCIQKTGVKGGYLRFLKISEIFTNVRLPFFARDRNAFSNANIYSIFLAIC